MPSGLKKQYLLEADFPQRSCPIGVSGLELAADPFQPSAFDDDSFMSAPEPPKLQVDEVSPGENKIGLG